MYPVSVPEDFTPQVRLIAGDALTELRRLPFNSVDCCVTSPPYYLQDDYNDDRQVGQEETPEEYIQRLVQVFGEVRRLLKRHGTVWINIGDTQRHGESFLIPHRLAIALHDDGWLLRSEIVVERANPIPYGQAPFQRTHEMLLLLAQCRGHYCEPPTRSTGLANSPRRHQCWRSPVPDADAFGEGVHRGRLPPWRYGFGHVPRSRNHGHRRR